MKNSNKAKRFWTLNRHHAGGFTLVELIVVIAILAILAGVAVPAYSGYVTQANKQADVSLAGEVAHALELAFYNRELPNGGMVVLTKDGVKTADGALSADSKAALEAAFGSVASVPGLKYDGWSGDYDGGSFKGNEAALLGKVENLTGSLASFLNQYKDHNQLMGGKFGSYMKDELGFSEKDLENDQKVADAAVLYVAHTTSNMSADQLKQLNELNKSQSADQMLNTMISIYDNNMFVGMAAAYAMMTGYCQTNGIAVGEIKNVPTNTSQASMKKVMMEVFGEAINHSQKDGNWAKYAKDSIGNDATAFLEVMGTVNGAKGLVIGNLGKDNCYTSDNMKLLVASYAAGNVVVIAEVQDGMMETTMIPAVRN